MNKPITSGVPDLTPTVGVTFPPRESELAASPGSILARIRLPFRVTRWNVTFIGDNYNAVAGLEMELRRIVDEEVARALAVVGAATEGKEGKEGAEGKVTT